MSISTIIRAWKDEEFRLGLSETERAELPANPAGLLELTDEELSAVTGGTRKRRKKKKKSRSRT